MSKIIETADTALASELKAALKQTGGYCPCAIERTPDTKCMCKEFREMEAGTCHCGLYVKVND